MSFPKAVYTTAGVVTAAYKILVTTVLSYYLIKKFIRTERGDYEVHP